MKTVKQIIEEIRADIEIRPTPLDEQLDELLKSYEKEIDELSNTFNETCQTLAWYINERQRLLKVIEYSKPNEGLQKTIQKALERPRGEWIEKHCDYGVYYRCSNCHKMPPNYECDYKEGAIKTNFCPNCGASMKKEGKNK